MNIFLLDGILQILVPEKKGTSHKISQNVVLFAIRYIQKIYIEVEMYQLLVNDMNIKS